MAGYGKASKRKVQKTMHVYKRGKLKSGRSGKKVKSRKQAIAIGLSQARRRGAKVPPKKKSSRRPARKTTRRATRKKSSRRSSKAKKR
jgi:hypothetical protein